MKKIFLVALIIISISANAQTWEEWFQQKETQKKYLLQQIAALEVYYDYAKKGYDIASKGLGIIQQIKNGDLNLHRDFFNSLLKVNPAIANWSRVEQMMKLQIKIVKVVKQSNEYLKQSTEFTKQVKDYCFGVLKEVAEESVSDMDELILITTTGAVESDRLRMKDDERIKRIEVLYVSMLSKYEFISGFSSELNVMGVREKKEIEILQSLIKKQ